jgi:DNA-directed DNA polymerase III PolC
LSFVHLHCHSNFSLLQGANTLKELIKEAKRQGMTSLALTDTNALYGAILFFQMAKAEGLKPILGAELDDSEGKAVVLARSETGFAQLCRLTTRKQLDENFSLIEVLRQELTDTEQEVFVLSQSPKLLRESSKFIRPQKLYVEINNLLDASSQKKMRELMQLAEELKLPLVATNNVHFIRPKYHRIHRILTAIRSNTTLGTLPPKSTISPQGWLKSPQEMRQLFRQLPHACDNALRIAHQCQLELELGKYYFPPFSLPEGETPYSYLCKLCFKGVAKRYKPLSEKVMDRLNSELHVIDRLGFSTYFLIVWDIVNFAKKRGMPTLGRGSAANSLVAYALGITHIDPLRYNLFFERFLNPERKTPPDIDLDFGWKDRDKVVDYVYEKYGPHRVAMICTFNTFSLRSSVREVAKAVGLPEDEIAPFTSRLPHFFVRSIEEAVEKLPECRELPIKEEPFRSIVKVGTIIQGYPRHLAVHAGGIVISPYTLTDKVPLQRATKGIIITQYDMHDIEKLGLIKIDLLCQRSLAVASDTLKTIKEHYGKKLDLNSDERIQKDPATVQLIREGNTIGCFYIESPGMRGLLKKLRVSTFEMLTAASSVIRPGVAQSGMMQQFIRRHNGKEKVKYLHPKMKEILAETYGVMIYQEDVIKVAHAIAGMSLGEADLLRRAMSGKGRSREAMERLARDFIKSAMARGVSRLVAREIWRQIASFAGYAFCKAHSASYAKLSYQVAYLKAHYPAEFMAAVISNQGGFYHTSVYLEEARRMGIRILLPDINLCDYHYIGKKDWIRIGLMQIKNMSRKTIESILEARKQSIFDSLSDFLMRTEIEFQEVADLIKCGAMECFPQTRPELLWVLELNFEKIKRLKKNQPGETNLFSSKAMLSSSENFPSIPDYPLEEKLRLEKQILEMTVSHHPLESYRKKLNRIELIESKNLFRYRGKRVKLAGWLVTTKRCTTSKGEFMKFVTLEDLSGVYDAVLFPKVYQKYGHLIVSRGPFIIEGKVDEDCGHCTITAEKIEVIAHKEDVTA